MRDREGSGARRKPGKGNDYCNSNNGRLALDMRRNAVYFPAGVTGASSPPLTKVVICSKISSASFGLQTSLASCSSRCVSENAYM